MDTKKREKYTATQNACKLCTALGASLAFKGIKGAVSMLHGSQGCATYARRYLISHFKEPVDIASSNFGEDTAIFGGEINLKTALDNITRQYQPSLIGIASTCLSETIGDDVSMFLREYCEENIDKKLPALVSVSTPGYQGTHIDGFHSTVKAVVNRLAVKRNNDDYYVNIFPGMVSPADIRYIKGILADFGLDFVMLPDYSETLDGSPWSRYQKIQKGGTTIEDIEKTGSAAASIEFGRILSEEESAGDLLSTRFKVPCHNPGLPIGVNETDSFFEILQRLAGTSVPEKYTAERGRLIDSYADAHKYVFETRAVVYGEEDMVVGLVSFLSEIGIIPVLCASGGNSGYLEKKAQEVIPDLSDREIIVREGVDFREIEEEAKRLKPDIIIGSSKGYSISRRLNIPLLRVGFPVHDRIGGSRIQHLGYRGAQQLFDRIVNTVIEKTQEDSPVGYSYM